MKVEVSRIKRPGIKVSVTLARARRAGTCISIPVHAAAKVEAPAEPEAEEFCIGFADTADDVIDEAITSCDDVPVEETVQDGDDMTACEDGADEGPVDELLEDAPDEEDLLALIEEEEAEMALHMQQQEASPFFDSETDPFAAEAVNEVADAEADYSSDQPAQVSQYMRYFDRNTDGQKFEVSDEQAIGQEIICVDEESGRLSRVCGFIKNNQSAQQSAEDWLDNQE